MRKIWLLLALCVLALPLHAQDSLYVYADEALGAISPFIYGSNFGIHSAIPAGLLAEAQNSGVRYLRWGGGFVDDNELTPAHIDTLIMNAKIVGAEPAITVRMIESTPEKSAEDVTYANITKGYNVKYWSIGNEPTLYDTPMFNQPYDTERYNREWRAHAEAMLAVDPTIILVGPDPHQYPGIPERNLKDKNGRDWMIEFLKANGDLVGIVSIHRYPFPRSDANPTITIEDLRQNPREWDEHIIPNLRAVIQEYTGRDLPIGVTEINSSWANNIGGEATLDSHYNAIWYGDVLGRLIRQRVTIAGYWQFGSRNTSFGILGGEVRPVYYTFQMYQQFGTEALNTASDFEDVQVYAARREDGALTVMVVNLGLEAATVPLSIRGFTPAAEAEVWLFDPENAAVAVGMQPLGDTITVNGQSLTLYVIAAGA
jgi:hypothetical protein